MSLHKFADMVASKGRGDDSLLIHMTPDEVQRLQQFAEANGRSLTINPDTGLPEAGMLSDLFKAVAPIALGAFLGPGAFGIAGLGMGATTAGLVTGGLTTLATGSLSRGLMAGLGAYGGAGLAQGFADAGVGAGMSEALAGSSSGNLSQAFGDVAATQGSSGQAFNEFLKSSANPATMSGTELASAGAKAAMDNPMAFAKQNFGNIAAAAAPIMAGAMVPTTTKLPENTNPAYIRQKLYDPYTQTYKSLAPVKASEWGSRSFSDAYTNPQTGEMATLQPRAPSGFAGGGIVALAIGGDTKKALEDAYAAAQQSGNYGAVNDLVLQNKITDADVRGTWGMDTSGLAGLGVNLYQPPAAVDANQLDYFGNPKNTQTTNVQELPVIPNNNALNAQTANPVDKEIFDYFTENQNLVKNKDYNTIASDMYTSGWTPEMVARATGTNVADVTNQYNQTYGAFDRATQEDLVNQKYKKQFGLTDAQLGQRYFGAPMDTRENRSTSRPFSNAYENYQQELAATGRRDAPAGTQFRAKAVYMPDSIGDRGSIKLIDTATGQELTNLGGANSIGNTRNAFELLDKFAVDPASYRQAASQMYESLGKPTYMQDDYKYLTGYKPRNVAAATNEYIRTPLEKATVADLRYNPEKDANNRFTKDTRTNIDWLGSTQRLLMSKGMGASEATNYLHQFIPVSGLVDWAEINKSKDPVKAMMGTLNYLQSKGVTNLDPNKGPFSKIGQTRFDASGKKLPARYTGAESLRSLGLRGFASGGITSLAIGGDVKGALENAYATAQQTGDYSKVNDIVSQNKITDADVKGTWGMDTSGLAGLGVNLYTPPAAPRYTQYSDEQIGQYLLKNPDANIAEDLVKFNADPAAFNKYVASLANPFVGSTDTKGGSGTLGIYNQMVAQGIDPNEAYAALIANDPKYGGWTKEMIQKGYDLDKGAYALSKELGGNVSDKDWVKFMDDNKYSIDDAAQAFGLSRNEVTRRYNAVKDAEKKVITPITKVTGTGTGTGTGVVPDGTYGRPDKKTPGDITRNDDGTSTVHPNIPYRPPGGFSGMGEVRDAYTKGGGSLGYTSYAPKTMEEFNQLYNKQTGDSLAAYDYLMGKGAGTAGAAKYPIQSQAASSTTGIMRPYFSGGMKYQPKFLSYDSTGNTVASSSNPNAPKPDAAASGTLKAKAINVLNSEGNTVEATLREDGYYYTSDGRKFDVTGAEVAAGGGMMGYAMGGGLGTLGSYSDGGRLLKGPGDGVSDSIPATIGRNRQPARLADGEFVIPARIVSELGNGSTEAGAKKLYAMMDRVQRARGKTTGKNKVAANSRADKYLPA